jgi:hypothetical protein
MKSHSSSALNVVLLRVCKRVPGQGPRTSGFPCPRRQLKNHHAFVLSLGVGLDVDVDHRLANPFA